MHPSLCSYSMSLLSMIWRKHTPMCTIETLLKVRRFFMSMVVFFGEGATHFKELEFKSVKLWQKR